MRLGPRSIVVTAKAGTHNHQPKFWLLHYPQPKAMHTVLANGRRGVWVPAFAGTTG